MAVSKRFQQDVAVILGKRHENGDDFWAPGDGRWGVGSPFATLDCVLMLHELGLARSDPVLKGAADCMFRMAMEDGRFRPALKGAVYPCHTANAARALCRLGYANDARLKRTFVHLFDIQHRDGGWRCNTVKLGPTSGLGPSEVTDASNPGVTLNVLDAFRFTPFPNNDKRLDDAVRSLIAHWKTRIPLGPCGFGIGSRFMQVEYPFFRYNLFSYVYVLSFYNSARKTKAFKEAFGLLQSKAVDDKLVVEHPNRNLAALSFCKKGQPSPLATKRYREIL